MTNTIIEEVREARAALAAEHGHDLQRIHQWAKAAHEALNKARRVAKPAHEVTPSDSLTPTLTTTPVRGSEDS